MKVDQIKCSGFGQENRSERVPSRYLPDKTSSEEVRAKAIMLFTQGNGYKKTARVLGLPESKVRDWLRSYKRGKFQAEVPMSLLLYDEMFRTKVLTELDQRKSIREVARETGVPAATIKTWKRRRQQHSGTDK